MSGLAPNNYDVDKIRQDFPILDKEVYGKRLAYLDNGASAQKPQCVIEKMSSMYQASYANVHRGLHYLSNAATDAYENARNHVARFINAASSDEIVFTKNATEAINLVAYSWAMSNITSGDEIIVSIMEHHSNLVPWHFVRERLGAKIIYLPVSDDGTFDIGELKNALTSRTKLIAITHMSNVLGTVLPVKKIVEIAHQAEIPVLVDGSQAAVHCLVDVEELNCDWYVFTGHKVYGPTGIGVLYGKKAILENMRPFLGGGEMIESVDLDKITYNRPPHRFEAGTPPIVEAIGLSEALNYFENVGRNDIFTFEGSLLKYAQEQLASIPTLRVYGAAPDKGPIISFELGGIHPHDVSMYVDRMGVAIRAGTHCAQPLLKRFGLTSTCRVSLAMYNNERDVDQLVEAVDRARRFFND